MNYVNKSSPSKALIYGIVLILAHLTKFPSVLTEEQKQIEKLKKLSVSKDNIDAINREKEEKDVRNQPNAVLERIKIVMDAGCCAMLVKLFKFVSEDVNQQQERKAYEENSALLIIRIWWCLVFSFYYE